MYKLKIYSKPKPIKMKCSATFPPIILANLQEKEATPTKEVQEIVADETYDGLSKVTVQAIPNEYIVPSGEIEFTQNGTYDVTDKASAKVNIKEKVLGTKTITSNGTYKAIDDNLDGYSEVEVATSGVDIWDYYEENSDSIFNIRRYIKKIPIFNLSGATSMNYAFSECPKLIEIPEMNTSKVQNFSNAFYGCPGLESIAKLNYQKAERISSMVSYCDKLTTLGGFQNLGQNYSTSQSENYSYYKLDLHYSTLLTHDSLMNVINNLYDIKTKGVKPQQVVLGSGNLAKLTEEERNIAVSKGWTLS